MNGVKLIQLSALEITEKKKKTHTLKKNNQKKPHTHTQSDLDLKLLKI